MQNSKSNLPICGICGKQIFSLGFEGRIIKNHQDRMEYGIENLSAQIDIKEFKTDSHLICRIKCARYYRVGMGTRWFSNSQFNLTDKNKIAFEAIGKIKRMNYQEMRFNGIYLYGFPGLGKTHLLADLCRSIIDRSKRLNDISWGNTSSILTKIRSSFGKKYNYGEETEQEKILAKLKVNILFLDDLGTESATEWTKEILYESINYRYEERLPLFISSNLPPQQLAEKMGDKFVSRIIEMCKSIRIEGEDMRLQKIETQEKNFNVTLPVFSYQMANWDLKS